MKKLISALLAVTMAATVAVSSVSAAEVTKTSTDALWSSFQNPSFETKSRPLWFWNDQLANMSKEEIRETLVKSKEESGYAGVAILPNWMEGYMSDEYLELYKYALQTAEELGMKMCLYDENGFPSGRAGGLLAQQYPEDTLKRLDKTEKDVTGPSTASVPLPTGQYRSYLGAVAMNMDTKEIIDISDHVSYVTEDTPGVYSSSNHPAINGETFTADKAFDGDYSTRWNAGKGQTTDQWLEARYAEDTTVDRIVIREALGRIDSYAIQYFDGENWIDISIGTTIGEQKEIQFDSPVTAKRFRLMIHSAGLTGTDDDSKLASIYEIELFNGSTKLPPPSAGEESVDRVTYTVPEGNWKLMAFATVKDGDDLVDYLSKSAVEHFVDITHEAYYQEFSEYFGTVIDSAFFDEPPLYRASGRTWTGEFNTMFEEANGYNPITLYPALWYDIGEDTSYARNALMGFRAELFASNYIGTMTDWCHEHGIKMTGHMDQEENVNPVTSDGDLMKVFKYQDIPGVDEVFSYDRARKAYKIVSSSANNWDKGLVMTESYGGMGEGMGIPVMYKDIMNQYAKGINYVVPHAIWYNNTQNVQNPPELSWRSEQYGPELANYNNFIGRTSGLLQNGRHVADIGVLYPIDTLQGAFQFDIGDPYTGNVTPEEADYMEVGDYLSSTLRRDFTYLHPEVIAEKCTVEGDTFQLNNEVNYENYKVIVIPGCKTISWEALKKIREFYDNGGKVVATTQLPYMSSEKGHNQDVVDTVKYMFGVDEDFIYGNHSRTYTASSYFQNNPTYAAEKAFDGVASLDSRWNAGDLSGGDQWLEVDFGTPTTVNKTVITESAPYRVTQYHIQYWDGSQWVNCAEGTSIGDHKTDNFEPVTTTKLRLYVDTIVSDSVSIQEFEVYNNDSENLALEPEKTADNSNENGGRCQFVGVNFRETLGPALDNVVENYDVEIDPVSTSGGDLTYIHKVKENNDIYYFANSSDNPVNTYVNIRKEFKNPMVWDPHTGTKYAPEYTVDNGITRIKLDIDAVKSVFIIDENTSSSSQTDKTILKTVIDEAKRLQQTEEYANAIPAVKQSFQKALDNAQTVYDNPAATQKDVVEAWSNLIKEIHKLGFQAGDKTELQALYDQVKDTNLDDYLDGLTKENFKTALANAKTVLDDKNALDTEIQKAYNELKSAFEALEEKPSETVDKSQLENLLQQCDSYQQDQFTPNTWEVFVPALKTAQNIYAKPDATQDEVNSATDTLLNAMLQLRYKADKSILENMVAQLETMDTSGYTPESLAVLNAAIQEAKTVLQDENLSKENQSVVDTQVENLIAAVASLEKQNSPNIIEKAAATGDVAPIAGIVLLALAGTEIIALRKRKK